MQILNLIDKNKSQIDYEIEKFPDGQINVHLNNIDRKDGTIGIVCRISSTDDIFLMMLIKDILQRQEISVDYIYITYLLTARMDRVMDMNQPFSLKIVANVINDFNAGFVFIQEAHSSKSFDLIKNSKPACEAFNINTSPEFLKKLGPVNVQYIFPDAGASKRYNIKESTSHVVRPIIAYDKMPYFLPTNMCCSKVRDPKTNELSGFKFESENKISSKTDVIIVRDDLCDAGGTFMGVGKIIKQHIADNFFEKAPKLILVVTHMIQAKIAIPKLLTIYDEVWFTNSYKDWGKEIDENFFDEKEYYKRIKIFDVTSYNFTQLFSGKEYITINK